MRLFLLLMLTILSGIVSGQEKYALIISPGNSKGPAEKINSRNDVQLITHALSVQGFKQNNITIDTAIADKALFFSQLDKITSKIRKRDFVLFYFDMPVKKEAGKSGWQLVAGNDPAQYISLDELTASLNSVSKKLNDPNLFFSLFNNETALLTDNPVVSAIEGISINGLIACRPGEKKLYSNNSSLFAGAVATALTSASSYITTYNDLLQSIEKNMLLHTTRQHPALLVNGENPALFNNHFIKSPVYFTVQSQSDNQTVIINAGQNINILPGTIVNFYPANVFDTARKMLNSGVVTGSYEITSVIKLLKPQQGAAQILWAYVGWNDNESSPINPLTFNTGFSQSGNTVKNKYFEAIVKEIKDDPKLNQYIKFVNTGGDLQISDIGLMQKDSISCTIINPRTGGLMKDFFYSTKSDKLIYDNKELDKYSGLEDYLIRTAEWQYLSKLHNPVPELQAAVELKSTANREVQKENGYPVVYENDELVLSLHNSGTKKIYFSIIGLRADKTSKLIYPGLGESGSTYFILPGGTFRTDPFSISPPFGQEKLKIITSNTPVELEELRQKNILTRKKERSSFLPEYVNIQDFEYEIRNSVYARNSSAKKMVIQTSIAANKIQINNPSAEKVFFNVLQRLDDGNYQTILPNQSYPGFSCVTNTGSQSFFELSTAPEANTQLIYLFADRPFLLTQYVSDDRSMNELLTNIIRNGRVPGSPLNKIILSQQVIPVQNKTASRGNDILIKLVSPRIANERTALLQAMSQDYNVNGFAFTEDNKPVQTIKVNGEVVEYDKNLKFFDKIVQLEGGRNKIVIEATDEKGFSTAQIFEVAFEKKEESAAPGNGVNYFLGIAIDNYKTWPPLFNAKNDVISFSKLMEQKFGYQSANFILLQDTAATRKNIIRQIRSFLVKIKPNDNVIIYFSGHGNKDQLTDGDYYFIPSDGEADDISSAVKSTDIIDNFKNIKAKNCLLIMDACFSGLITNSVNNNQRISLLNSNKNLSDLPSKWIITSGRATKVSDGIAGTNSPFASVMINYLKENTEESKLTISKLIDYLKDNVPKFNKQQIPFGMSIAGEGELTFKIVNK